MKLKAVIFKELLADHDRQEAEIAKLKEALSEKGEYGYSQFAMDALTQERDKLMAEIVKLKEENSELRDGSPVKPQTTKE